MRDMAEELLKFYAERRISPASLFRLTGIGTKSSKRPLSLPKLQIS